MKNNKKLLLSFICVIAIIVVLTVAKLLFGKKQSEEPKNNNQLSTSNNEEESKVIEKIKKKVDARADTNMYEVQEEYDGRKIIQIKSNIQFDTVLAGILKNALPKEAEIDKIIKDRPTKSGIWISKQSRTKFLKLLKDNNLNGYEIDEEGYLVQSENAKNNSLNKAILSEKLYIIDISGKCYNRDEITGKIIEYPFEEMEPDQVLEKYSVDNSSILVITSNSQKILTSKEIMEEIFANLEEN